MIDLWLSRTCTFSSVPSGFFNKFSQWFTYDAYIFVIRVYTSLKKISCRETKIYLFLILDSHKWFLGVFLWFKKPQKTHFQAKFRNSRLRTVIGNSLNYTFLLSELLKLQLWFQPIRRKNKKISKLFSNYFQKFFLSKLNNTHFLRFFFWR